MVAHPTYERMSCDCMGRRQAPWIFLTTPVISSPTCTLFYYTFHIEAAVLRVSPKVTREHFNRNWFILIRVRNQRVYVTRNGICRLIRRAIHKCKLPPSKAMVMVTWNKQRLDHPLCVFSRALTYASGSPWICGGDHETLSLSLRWDFASLTI